MTEKEKEGMLHVNFYLPKKVIEMYNAAVSAGYFPNISEAYRHGLVEYASNSPTLKKLVE